MAFLTRLLFVVAVLSLLCGSQVRAVSNGIDDIAHQVRTQNRLDLVESLVELDHIPMRAETLKDIILACIDKNRPDLASGLLQKSPFAKTILAHMLMDAFNSQNMDFKSTFMGFLATEFTSRIGSGQFSLVEPLILYPVLLQRLSPDTLARLFDRIILLSVSHGIDPIISLLAEDAVKSTFKRNPKALHGFVENLIQRQEMNGLLELLRRSHILELMGTDWKKAFLGLNPVISKAVINRDRKLLSYIDGVVGELAVEGEFGPARLIMGPPTLGYLSHSSYAMVIIGALKHDQQKWATELIQNTDVMKNMDSRYKMTMLTQAVELNNIDFFKQVAQWPMTDYDFGYPFYRAFVHGNRKDFVEYGLNKGISDQFLEMAYRYGAFHNDFEGLMLLLETPDRRSRIPQLYSLLGKAIENMQDNLVSLILGDNQLLSRIRPYEISDMPQILKKSYGFQWQSELSALISKILVATLEFDNAQTFNHIAWEYPKETMDMFLKFMVQKDEKMIKILSQRLVTQSNDYSLAYRVLLIDGQQNILQPIVMKHTTQNSIFESPNNIMSFGLNIMQDPSYGDPSTIIKHFLPHPIFEHFSTNAWIHFTQRMIELDHFDAYHLIADSPSFKALISKDAQHKLKSLAKQKWSKSSNTKS